MADKVLATNVQQGDWLGRVVERDGKKIFLQGRKITPEDKPTASPYSKPAGSSSTGKSSGSLEGTMGESKTSGLGTMANFQIALKNALNEAASNRTAAHYTAFDQAGLVGKTPGTLSSVVSMIRGGAKTEAVSVFESAIEGYKYEREHSLEMLKQFASDGSLAMMPDSALQKMGATAGIDPGILSGWKQRIQTATELSDSRAKLEIRQIEAEIGETLANTARLREQTRASAAGGGGDGGAGGTIPTAGLEGFDSATIFAASTYSGITDEEAKISYFNNLPAATQKSVSAYLGRLYTQEQSSVEGLQQKLNIGRVQPGGTNLSDNELRMFLFGIKDEQGSFDDAMKEINNYPIANRDRARSIARDIWQPSQPTGSSGVNMSVAPNQSIPPKSSSKQATPSYDFNQIGAGINQNLMSVPSLFKLW